jgi:putative transposase
MARLARLCIAGLPHLVIQRSRAGEPVLAEARDSHAYLACLREAAATARIALHAFALMPTQVRLLVTPTDAAALGSMMQAAGRRFVGPYNRRHARSGPLWVGRFHATVIEPAQHFVECLRFVESAPVQFGLLEQADAWQWSSAAHHTGRSVVAGLTEQPAWWALGNTPFEREMAYARLLETPLSEVRCRAIEGAALQGWVTGSAGFAQEIAGRATRRVLPSPRGRPAGSRSKTPPVPSED